MFINDLDIYLKVYKETTAKVIEGKEKYNKDYW